MNFAKIFNQREKNLNEIVTEKVLNYALNYDEEMNESINTLYMLIHKKIELLDLVKSEKMDYPDFLDKMVEIISKQNKIYEFAMEYLNGVKKYRREIDKFIREYDYETAKLSAPYIKNKTFIVRRIIIQDKKMDNIIKTGLSQRIEEVVDLLIELGCYDKKEFLDEKDEILKIRKAIKEKEQLQNAIDKREKADIQKIFDYRSMCKLAYELGYEDVRQSGSHISFKHKKSNKIVPIPQHNKDYGKGVMITIQKQLYNNSKLNK